MFSRIAEFLRKFKPHLYAEVPANTAACEFDCRELDCSEQNWQHCSQRLEKAGAIQSLEHSDRC